MLGRFVKSGNRPKRVFRRPALAPRVTNVFDYKIIVPDAIVVMDRDTDCIVCLQAREFELPMQADLDLERSASDSLDVTLACPRVVGGLVIRIIVELQGFAVRDDLDA